MSEREAINLVKKNLSGYEVSKIKETPQVFLFMCKTPDPEMVPSKIAVAVNKKTGKFGSSIRDYDEAIRAAL